MRKNILSYFIVSATVCSMFFSNSLVLSAKEAEMSKEYFESIQIAEEVDTQILIENAKLGIDEFKEKTGANFCVFSQINDSNTLTCSIPEKKYSIETYQTSQYLGTVENECGDLCDLYILQGITVYSSVSPSDTKTNGSCTIKTTLYVEWSSTDISALRLIRSTSTISGTQAPVSLVMQNCVYEGWDTLVNHYNTQTITTPSNSTYTLYPSYAGYINQFGGYVGAEDTVYFSGGNSLTTSVYYDC